MDSVDDLVGIWMPTEVNGESVDAGAVGAYLEFSPAAESLRMSGYDGCNGHDGFPSGAGPTLSGGRLVAFDFSQEAQDCPEDLALSPGSEATLSVTSDEDHLLADDVAFVGSIRYERVDSVPVDPRVAIRDAEEEAREEEERAAEAAERAEIERTQVEARALIREQLPTARTRWAESGVADYTLRFENASLRNDPSFPERRPVGGVWEIEVVGGVAAGNEWSDSVLGDTVEDWFDFVESQLDSSGLEVEFDPELGYPITIFSQPLDDDEVGADELTSWIVRAEVEPTG